MRFPFTVVLGFLFFALSVQKFAKTHGPRGGFAWGVAHGTMAATHTHVQTHTHTQGAVQTLDERVEELQLYH